VATVVPTRTLAFFDEEGAWHQTGLATWYGGSRWQGHATASGARFNQNGLTAAHATLPLGARVRVRLAGSERAVVVTINDRPGTGRVVIDLSRGAARALGILDRGVADVELSMLQ
jgi:rare lipoprotein A